jgi:hypothetical protein
VAVEIHVGGGGGGGFLAVVEKMGLAVVELVPTQGADGAGADEHEASTADVAGGGVDDGEGETDGHGGVDGVATFAEDLEAGVGGVVVDGDDDGVGGAGGLGGEIRWEGSLGEEAVRHRGGDEGEAQEGRDDVLHARSVSGLPMITAGPTLEKFLRWSTPVHFGMVATTFCGRMLIRETEALLRFRGTAAVRLITLEAVREIVEERSMVGMEGVVARAS